MALIQTLIFDASIASKFGILLGKQSGDTFTLLLFSLMNTNCVFLFHVSSLINLFINFCIFSPQKQANIVMESMDVDEHEGADPMADVIPMVDGDEIIERNTGGVVEFQPETSSAHEAAAEPSSGRPVSRFKASRQK